ncbi:MAG TPA: hypothetical protein PKC89_05690 [Pyrinomonadaceae bacterium]|nr:hypothetical protein [Pyrinomonadaceae bacterium]
MNNVLFWSAVFFFVAPVLILAAAYYRRNDLPILRYLFAGFVLVLGANNFVTRWSISLVPELGDRMGPFFTHYYLDWYFVPYHILMAAAVLAVGLFRTKK